MCVCVFVCVSKNDEASSKTQTSVQLFRPCWASSARCRVMLEPEENCSFIMVTGKANGTDILNVHLPNSLGLIEGFCTVCEQPWVDLNPQPFAQKATTLTTAPRRPHTHGQLFTCGPGLPMITQLAVQQPWQPASTSKDQAPA